MSNTKPLTKEAIDEIAKKSFTDYIAGRRDSRGNPTPAPAECPATAAPKCAMCDGSGRKGGWGDISDTPCPSCYGTGRGA